MTISVLLAGSFQPDLETCRQAILHAGFDVYTLDTDAEAYPEAISKLLKDKKIDCLVIGAMSDNLLPIHVNAILTTVRRHHTQAHVIVISALGDTLNREIHLSESDLLLKTPFRISAIRSYLQSLLMILERESLKAE